MKKPISVIIALAGFVVAQIPKDSPNQETSSGATELHFFAGGGTEYPSMTEVDMLGMADGSEWFFSVVPERGFQYVGGIGYEFSNDAVRYVDHTDSVRNGSLHSIRMTPLAFRVGLHPLLRHASLDESAGEWILRASPFFQIGLGVSYALAPSMGAIDSSYIQQHGTPYDNSFAGSLGWYTEWDLGLSYRILDNLGVVLAYRSTDTRFILSTKPGKSGEFFVSPIKAGRSLDQSGLMLGIEGRF
jgi:hypothetical protein